MLIAKSYKPEIDNCPLCGAKLKYRYSISNKNIQFSDGKRIKIKNLAYSCSNSDCTHPDFLYTSQTATKMCMKGYTYSAKVLALILYYKHLHKSREEITNILVDEGIEISDRNVDIIYEKLEPYLNMDYKKNIEFEYAFMNRECGGVYLSIDVISLFDGYNYFVIRNFFTSNIIGCHIVKCINDEDYNILNDYLNPSFNIKQIITVRPLFRVYDEIKKRVDENTKFLHFLKF